MEYCRHSLMKSFKIITGERGEGKTTFILSHFSFCKGYVSLHRGEEYYLKKLESGEENLLLTHRPIFKEEWKGWFINSNEFHRANDYLLSLDNSIVVLDEVGMLEVEEKGFFPFLTKAQNMNIDLIISVRREFVDVVKDKFFPSISPLVISLGRAP